MWSAKIKILLRGGAAAPPPALAFSSQLTQTSIFSAHWEVLDLISETLESVRSLRLKIKL